MWADSRTTSRNTRGGVAVRTFSLGLSDGMGTDLALYVICCARETVSQPGKQQTSMSVSVEHT